ncbi:MAG: hypothetical protein ACRCTA_02025, partial [Bacilli bacterium]
IYLAAKDIKIADIQNKIEDIKVDISKIDFNTSKEFVAKQGTALKGKLNSLLVSLQENKKIQPALEGAIDKTQNAIISTIDFIEEKELIEKTKDAGAKVVDASTKLGSQVVEGAKENSSIVKEKVTEGFASAKEEVIDKIDKVSSTAKEKIDDVYTRITKKKEDDA